MESSYAVRYLLPLASVTQFHLLFPDPWPKRRHWKHRVFQPDFLLALHATLLSGGELRLKTDDGPYFAHMREVYGACPLFKEHPWPSEEFYPCTDFEKGFLEERRTVYQARLVKL